MEANTDAGTGTKRRSSTKGRVDKDRQEAVIDKSAVADKVDYLVKLYKASEEAAKDFSEAIKAISEKAGLNASPVRKYIIARAGEDFEKVQKQVAQLSLLFSEE